MNLKIKLMSLNEKWFDFSLYKFHRKPSHSNLKELPGVSIIKPLTGIDTNLYENLKTFFTLQYPRVCILQIKFLLFNHCFSIV